MQLIEIKKLFFDSLEKLYPEEEIYSLFERTIEHFLKYTKIELHQNLNTNIEDNAEKKILTTVNRLTLAEPLQYILGQTYFYDCQIYLDCNVLIPRPETEYLLDCIIKETPKEQNLKIVDLGTGSGCIAIVMASHFINSTIYATDVFHEALSLAKKNASANRVNIKFIYDDLLSPKAYYPIFDLIISNPPYVRKQEKEYIHRNVLDYEPELALFVEDEDPLIFYKAIADFAHKYLKSNGKIYAEINEYLYNETADIFRNSGYTHIEIIKDLDNKNRFIKIIR
jgi:release factor glutamine methyltransferase